MNLEERTRLREKAEEILNQNRPETNFSDSKTDLMQLIHELEVYQIELEMQADELKNSYYHANESQKKYLELYNNAPMGYFTLSKDGIILEMNLRAANMLGNERIVLKKSHFALFVKEECRLDFYHFLEEIINGINNVSCDLSIITMDFKDLYVQLTGNLSESVDQINIIANDITERKLIENSLRDKEERLRLALLATNDVVWDWDIVNDCQRWNEAGERVFGWSEIVKNDVNAAWWMERVHPDDLLRVENGFDSALENSSNFYWYDDYKFRKSDGTYAEVIDRAYILRDHDGYAIRMIGAMQDVTEKKNADKLIKENEFKFETLADFTHDMEYWQLPDGIIYYMSPACERITGYTREEFIADPKLIQKIIHPDDKDYFINHLNESYDNGIDNQEKEINFRIINKNGQTVWIEHVCKGIYDDKNNYLGRRVSHRDISERKHADEALRKSESIKEKIVSNIGDVVVIIDKDGINKYKSPNITKLFGWTPEELIGKSTWENVHPYSMQSVREFFSTILSEPNATGSTELLYKCKNSEYVWVKISVINLLHDNDIKGLLGNYHEITERKKSEELINQEKLFNEMLIESLPGIFYMFDSNFTPLKWNRNKAELLGLTNEEMKTHNTLDFIAHKDKAKVVEAFQKTFMEGESQIIVNIDNKTGYEYTYHLTGKRLDTADGSFLLGVGIDVSERVKAENELVKALHKAKESDSLKSAFLQNLSHEVRTPLNGILGFSKLLQGEDLDKEEIKEYTTIILNSGKRLQEVINNILEISKIETGQIDVYKKLFNLNTLLNKLYKSYTTYAESKKLMLFCQSSSTHANYQVFSDESKLEQILSNLINNAIKFTSTGNIDFGYEIENDDIMFYVRDTGIGIQPAHKARIFDRFTQVDLKVTRGYEGIGLGLAICQGFVEILGGRIWVESEFGVGTTFYFTIPQVKADVQAKRGLFD